MKTISAMSADRKATAATMTVARRVALGYIVPILALVVVLLVGITTLNAAVRSKDTVIDTSVPRLITAHEVLSVAQTQSLALRAFLVSGNDTRLDEMAALEADFAAELTRLSSADGTAPSDLLATIQRRAEEWTDVADEAIERRTTAPDDLAAFADRELFPKLTGLREAIDALITSETESLQAHRSASERDANQARWITVGLGLLALGFGGFAGWLMVRGINRSLGSLAGAVESAGDEIAAAAAQQVSATSEQAVAVQQTVATVEELVMTAEQTSTRAAILSEQAETSAAVARDGEAAISEVISAVADVSARTRAIEESMSDLTGRARAVSAVIDTVEEVAEQTHLLALNASIEAARAGEHGRGFAVVAAEVRGLAEQAKGATDQVAEILGEINTGVSDTAQSTEEATSATLRADEQVRLAGDTIRALGTTVEGVLTAAEQITAASQQQAAATSQINEAMRNIEEGTEQTLAGSRQLEATADGLNRVTRDLRSLVTTRSQDGHGPTSHG